MPELTDAELIKEVITNALETAEEYTLRAGAEAQNIMAIATGRNIPTGPNQWTDRPSATADYVSFKARIEAIEPAVPEVENSTFTYEAQLDKLVRLLSAELAGFFNQYYPLTADGFDEATNWLVNAITNGGTGIRAEIEAQIYQRGRERLLIEGARLENKIASADAARGFVLPSGSMIAQRQEARFATLGAAGEQATTIATKQAEMEIANIRFAIEQVMDSRKSAMAAAADYIRAIASAPDSAARMASLNADAKARMMSATADMYRARLTRDQLVIGSETARMQTSASWGMGQLADAQNRIDAQVRAVISAADVYAKTASAALASLNAIASTTTSSFS